MYAAEKVSSNKQEKIFQNSSRRVGNANPELDTLSVVFTARIATAPRLKQLLCMGSVFHMVIISSGEKTMHH
jgi:hypothetical protein